jgi:hypothetical protein
VSEETAFRSAVKMLGTIDELTREYSKNQRIGHALSVIANVPYGTQVLGIYLMVVACLMSYSTVAAYYAYFSGRFTPPNEFPFVLALAFIAAFGWYGFKGFQLLRGRVLSYGGLLGLLALLLVQVPIIGGQLNSSYEFSAGLRYAILFGPVEDHFVFNPGAVIHINSAFDEPYFGINIVALLASLFVGLRVFDKWRKDEALAAHSATAA